MNPLSSLDLNCQIIQVNVSTDDFHPSYILPSAIINLIIYRCISFVFIYNFQSLVVFDAFLLRFILYSIVWIFFSSLKKIL